MCVHATATSQPIGQPINHSAQHASLATQLMCAFLATQLMRASLATQLMRASLARRYGPRASWLRGYLAHVDAGVRAAAAKLLAAAAPGLESAEALEDLLAGLTQ
eukprot:305469-Chlamydomonas_euryale.AAC.1